MCFFPLIFKIFVHFTSETRKCLIWECDSELFCSSKWHFKQNSSNIGCDKSDSVYLANYLPCWIVKAANCHAWSNLSLWKLKCDSQTSITPVSDMPATWQFKISSRLEQCSELRNSLKCLNSLNNKLVSGRNGISFSILILLLCLFVGWIDKGQKTVLLVIL